MSSDTIRVVSLEDVAVSEPEPGMRRQVLAYNDRMMLVRHLLAKGWVGARHSHPHEQLMQVVSGHLRFTAGEQTFEIHAGDSFMIPGGMEHQASAFTDSEVLDVFTPYREDYAPGVGR